MNRLDQILDKESGVWDLRIIIDVPSDLSKIDVNILKNGVLLDKKISQEFIYRILDMTKQMIFKNAGI